MFGCGAKYFSERLKLERVYKTYMHCELRMNYTSPAQNVQIIYDSVNISLTEIILVSK